VDEIAYRIRHSQRARRVRVTVDGARGVEVVLPRRATEHDAVAAIRELRPWIERQLRQLDRAHATVRARGDRVPYLDELLEIDPERGRRRVHRSGCRLLTPSGAELVPAVERWYKRAARDEIAPRLDAACARAQTSYSSLSIRGQRTRWASCSRGGAMSFNWRLLLAPERVLDYVIWHEVCHLHVMDHSPRFWSLLASHCPEYREPKGWLRRHGATLVLPGERQASARRSAA